MILITLGMSYTRLPATPPTAPHPPPPKTREDFDLPYLSVIAPRSELQVTAQGSPGDPPTLLVRGLVHRSQPQEKSA